MTKNMNDVKEIRGFILEQTEPFCLVDLYRRAEDKGITSRKMLLRVLDELHEEGLIRYQQVKTAAVGGDTALWAFYIAK